MEFKNPYWTEKVKIELLQKWLLVQSAIYYELDSNLVTDFIYDANCKQLKALIKQAPEAHKQSKWYHAFKNFHKDTSTSGFNLLKRLNRQEKYDIINTATYLVQSFAKIKNGE